MKPLNMSFEEKSTWVSLAIITFVFVGYFSQVYEGLLSGSLDKAAVTALFTGAVIAIIVLEVVFHIVIAARNVKDADRPNDERDRVFSIKAGNISGWVRGRGVVLIAGHTFMKEPEAIWVANLLLFVVFVSQVVSYALQIFYYRRGY